MLFLGVGSLPPVLSDPAAPGGVSTEGLHPVALAQVTTNLYVVKPMVSPHSPFGPISRTRK